MDTSGAEAHASKDAKKDPRKPKAEALGYQLWGTQKQREILLWRSRRISNCKGRSRSSVARRMTTKKQRQKQILRDDKQEDKHRSKGQKS